MNFREVNKKLKALKKAENAAKGAYLLSDLGSGEEITFMFVLDEARYQLDNFRNTKLSEINFK